MSAAELLHALISGFLAAGIYWLIRIRSSWLDGKTAGRKFLILAPIYFVLFLILNTLWPYGL